ncbi:uncharacterized protein BXZ73DRAFT_107897 [Epithele typhae]|uniref:uncharacterized protein n=1 Tax=Epithele typhae TaxID=378194 RepID=UPI0020072B41|nr:uncharacterized protein BXZ73DRAFT_107897 [Epithele typhae]KAH9911626.1 hypothetical protein BXZ73DRAFT_107897 [Epithele typhae]
MSGEEHETDRADLLGDVLLAATNLRVLTIRSILPRITMDSSCLNAALRSLSSLHVLHLENQVDQAVLESGLLLPPSVRVFSFCFSNSSSLASLLRAISRLPHLQDLSVLGHGSTEDVTSQPTFPSIRRLQINDAEIPCADKLVACCPNLDSLDIILRLDLTPQAHNADDPRARAWPRLRTLKVRAAEDLPYAAARAARCDVLNLASLDLRTGCEGPAWRIPPGFEGVLAHGDEPEEGFDSDDEELGAAADYSEAMYSLVRTAVPVRLACAVTVGGAGFGGGTLWARLAREGPSVRSLVLRVEEEQAKEDSNRWQWLGCQTRWHLCR